MFQNFSLLIMKCTSLPFVSEKFGKVGDLFLNLQKKLSTNLGSNTYECFYSLQNITVTVSVWKEII